MSPTWEINTISAYTIDSTTGVTTQLLKSPFTSGTEPVFVTTDPAGKFLYVCNQTAKNISQFAINPDSGGFLAARLRPRPSVAGATGVCEVSGCGAVKLWPGEKAQFNFKGSGRGPPAPHGHESYGSIWDSWVWIARGQAADAGICAGSELPCHRPVTAEHGQGAGSARQHNIPLAFDSAEELCRSPEVDAVFVTTPNACHLSDVLLAIRCGKAGVVRKADGSQRRPVPADGGSGP